MTFRQGLFRLLVLIGLILVVMGGGGLYLMSPAFRSPTPAIFAPPRTQAEANRQDLAYASRSLHTLDRSFSAAEWVEFDRGIAALSLRADKLDAAALELGLSKVVAAANNGHTNLLGVARGLTLNAVPLRLYWFADGLYVVSTDSAHTQFLGAKVLSIGGRTPETLVDLLQPYVGGRDSLRRELSIFLMESPQALHAAGLQDTALSTRYGFQTLDGSAVVEIIAADKIAAAGPPPERTLQTLKFDPRELHWPRRELSPVRLPRRALYPHRVDGGNIARHILAGRALAVSLQHPDRFYWSTTLQPSGALYLQINAMINEPGGQTLSSFLKQSLGQVVARRPRCVIVDLRANPGGSYQLTADFARDLPKVMPRGGKIFILTSANTFSAAVITAARLKYFAGSNGQIIGSSMGDNPQFWAEAAGRIVLPNSGIRIGYATGYHDWQHGCSLREIYVCYLPNYIMGVAAGDIEPAIRVSWSFADYLAGHDTLLDRITSTLETPQ